MHIFKQISKDIGYKTAILLYIALIYIIVVIISPHERR